MEISVVVVSDYRAGNGQDWDEERRCLAALARQDLAAPVEHILCVFCVDESVPDSVPPDLLSMVPNLRVLNLAAPNSYVQKNRGVEAATAPLIALLDVDCQPSPNWLRCSLETLRLHPEAAAVSGRTVYPHDDPSARIFALLGRSYLDPGRSGPTRFIANNGSVVRRDVYLAHPLPEDLGPFSARIQSEAILRDGHTFWFHSGIEIVHQYAGWDMEADIRRHLGWCTVATRLQDPSLPYARLVRLGPIALPLVWSGKLINTWRDTLRCFRAYHVSVRQLPYALGLGVVLSILEIPGMWSAWRGRPIQRSAYR